MITVSSTKYGKHKTLHLSLYQTDEIFFVTALAKDKGETLEITNLL